MSAPAMKLSPVNAGFLPDRVKPALFEIRDGHVTVLAYFVDGAAMQRFLAYEPRVQATPTRSAPITKDTNGQDTDPAS